RLQSSSGAERWVGVVASSIEPTDLGGPLLLIQWVDLSARRRAEQARAELLVEQSARTHAEAIAERLNKLQTLAEAAEALSLSDLLVELAARLGELFDSDMVEIEIEGESPDQPLLVRSARGRVLADDDEPPAHSGRWEEVRLSIERSSVGAVRLALP